MKNRSPLDPYSRSKSTAELIADVLCFLIIPYAIIRWILNQFLKLDRWLRNRKNAKRIKHDDTPWEF